MANKYNFPDDFTLGEEIRNKVINDILFSQNPPSVEAIFEYIPKQLICQINDNNIENYRSWNMWVTGSLNTIWEFRNNKDKNKNQNDGWGKQNTLQRSIIENQIYNIIKNQQEQIEEYQKIFKHIYKQIDELKNKN